MDLAWNAYQIQLDKQLTLELRINLDKASQEASVEDAQQAYDEAVANLNYARQGPDANKLALAQAKAAVAEADLAQAGARLAELKGEPLPEGATSSLSAARNQVEQAKLALEEAKSTLADTALTAPFAGVILEANALAGETIPAATALFTLADPQAVEVETTVIEEDVPYVTTGQPAEVYFDALPGEILTGTVAHIVPQRVSGDRPLYHVYLTLSRVPAALFEGMSADASIIIAQREGVLCLPRALAQASADGTATVEVWADGETQKRLITVGLRGDTYVEILSGLKEGEAVVAR
jgi:RND family efflux transporter MFP subunit